MLVFLHPTYSSLIVSYKTNANRNRVWFRIANTVVIPANLCIYYLHENRSNCGVLLVERLTNRDVHGILFENNWKAFNGKWKLRLSSKSVDILFGGGGWRRIELAAAAFTMCLCWVPNDKVLAVNYFNYRAFQDSVRMLSIFSLSIQVMVWEI